MSTSRKQTVDKFADTLKRKTVTPVPHFEDTSKATILPPIICVTCPKCASRVHPRVRTFSKKDDGFDEVRGMCPVCGGVYWVYNRERECFNTPVGATPRGPVRYVYKP